MRAVFIALLCAACGGESGGTIDAPTADSSSPDGGCTNCCGNGIVEGAEACDDGNTNDFDGCSHDCRFEGPLILEAIQEQPVTIGCDFTGDGLVDNALGGALNDAARDLLSSYVTNSLLKGCVVGSLWMLVGNDRRMEAAPFDVTTLAGTNLDGTGASNFNGDARFQILDANLDINGHPIIQAHGSAPNGMFMTDVGRLLPWLPYCTEPGMKIALEFDHASSTGTLVSDGNGPMSLMMRVCAARSARSWYNVRNDTGLPGNTMLDLLVVGISFAAYHITPTQPDFDTDGDGFEHFMDTDNDGAVDLCIDGNGTQITGTTCPMDPRMADGYTETLDLTFVRAQLAGRAP